MADKSENATSRIPVNPETHERLKAFRAGLGATFDEAINTLLNLAANPDEDDYNLGKRLRQKMGESK